MSRSRGVGGAPRSLVVAVSAVVGLAMAGMGSFSCGGDETNGGAAGSGAAGASTGSGGSNAGGAGSGTSTAAGGSGGSAGGGSGGGGSSAIDCSGGCRYVREGASGASDGSDWDNAFPALPEPLDRGLIYVVADGNYPAYTFDDPAQGVEWIRVIKATAADHGTDTGWQNGYGDGNAAFGPLSFNTSYHEFDGRGASVVRGEFQGSVVQIDGDNVTLRGTDLDGAFLMSGGMHTAGACTVLEIGGNDVHVEGCDIHDAADDGVVVGGVQNLSFVSNRVHTLYGCGTDGNCGPCYNGHSDGFEIYNVKDSQFIGNMAWDIASTSTFFFGNWADELGGGPSEYCDNITLANNLLYNPQTGFVAYIEDANRVHVYNNVIWGLNQGAYGGLSVGMNVSDLHIYNNVILSINYTHIGGSYNAAEHHGDYNLFGKSLGQWQDQANDKVAADPLFTGIPDINGAEVPNPPPGAFAPQASSPLRDAGYAGDATIQIPKADFFGTQRDMTPNIGAIE